MSNALKDIERIEKIREEWNKKPIDIVGVIKSKRYTPWVNFNGYKHSTSLRLLYKALTNGNQRARKYPKGSEPYRTKDQWRKKEVICPPLSKEEMQIKPIG